MIIKTRLLAGVAAFAVLASGATMLAAPAVAAPTTPATAITNDPNAGNGSLNLSFYNSAGARVTSGNDLTHLFDYALASSAGRSGATRATLYFAFPDSTKANSQSWFRSAKSGSTIFPNTNAPAPLNNATNPLATLTPTDGNLAGLLPTTTQDKSAGYDGILQVRVYDSGPGVPVQSSPFWASDIYYDQAANTWQQVYPTVASASPTATTLGANPTSPSTVGTSVTFTASVNPAAAGTVQFKDGSTDLGTPVMVSNGTATYSTATLAAGPHSITATFAPTDTAAYVGSTSTALSYTVDAAAATTTTTTLGVTPTSPAPAGTLETLTATVTPPDAAGTVTFKDGDTNIGAAATVTSGTATTTTTLASGSHSLTAVFTPTDATAFASSTGSATYVVNPATATTTTLAVTPIGSADANTTETLTATVAPAEATGTVTFTDGSATLAANVAVTSGTATTTIKLAPGSHSLTAAFTPTDAAVYASSTSTAASYTVNPAPATTTTLTVAPAGPAPSGTTQTLTATVGPNTAEGTVTFKDGTTTIASGVAVTNGSASTTTVLASGSHSLTAVFTPTDVNLFSGSTSDAVTYVVVAPPATDTTVAISAPRTVPYGKPAAVSVAVVDASNNTRVGNVPVSLYRRVAGQSTYNLVTTITTTANGTGVFSVAVGSNSLFYWKFAASTGHNAAQSAVLPVSVVPTVTIAATKTALEAGQSSQIYGNTAPATTGTVVYLQRLLNGTWSNLASTTVKNQKLPNGRTSLGYVFIRTFTAKANYALRVAQGATSSSLSGISKSITIRVS